MLHNTITQSFLQAIYPYTLLLWGDDAKQWSNHWATKAQWFRSTARAQCWVPSRTPDLTPPAHVAACSLLPFLPAEFCLPTGRSQVHIRVSDNASVARFPELAAQKQELIQLKAFQVTKAACKAGEKLPCRLNNKWKTLHLSEDWAGAE